MGSLNFNPFGGNWFKKPKTPLQLINPNPFHSLKHKFQTPNFSSISSSVSSITPIDSPPEDTGRKNHTKWLERLFQEQETRPDYRHDPAVDEVMKKDPVFEEKKELTQKELEENEQWWNDFRENPVVKFYTEVKEFQDRAHDKEMKDNSKPLNKEDEDLWNSLPHVIGLDGRPMPRKSIDPDTAYLKFWDFMKEFLFGLWGYKNRPYPPGRPINITQVLGTKALENRYYDFIMKSSGYFYKDRLGRTRGPMELIQLKTAWGAGIIDKNTFVWGEDMDEWAPICMIYGMERAVATWDARLGAAATAFFHNILKGKAPWAPVKGHRNLTYKQAQQEAIESKKRDFAVLKANDGIWPGARVPSHSLFLWASGTELTSILEADHMPNKAITKDMRIQLQKAIPGLRPWEVLSIEQAVDQITYDGHWYREPLGVFMTGPNYIRDTNLILMEGPRKTARFVIKQMAFARSVLTHDFPMLKKFFGAAYVDYVMNLSKLKRRFRANKVIDDFKEWAEILGSPKSSSSN